MNEKQRAQLRIYFLKGFEEAQKCKKKGFKSIGRRFPSGEKFEFEDSPEEVWQRCVEGKYRYALVATWETPTHQVYENIETLKKEFIGDLEMQGKIKAVENFFREIVPHEPVKGEQANLYWYSISELKQICRDRGLSDEGSKENLIRRLK